MPTPVNTAKQCLNVEACNALDDAVSVARRRGHAQTTSLHAVSAFLSLSPSQLKEACVRAKNSAFYPKVQLKALDFCLSVSLDRLPVSQPRVVDEPKISNSLMAAIKRSQANQRRHPDHCLITSTRNSTTTTSSSTTQVGHCQQEQLGSSSSSSNGVKVELQHLIVSILDDPIVSRVFNDAGFSSFDVKLALFRPFQNYLRYPPSVFGVFADPNSWRFRFPFSGYGDEEGDYRRIGEVLVRKKGKNPLLVGINANDVLKGFVEVLEKRKESVYLPLELHGINVVSIEKDVLKFVSENWSHESVSLWVKEVDTMVKQCLGPGLLVSFGDLRSFLGGCNDVVNYVYGNLSNLLQNHGNRVWLIGSAVNDQIYMEFLHKFPSIDKGWDLQPLPITSSRPSFGKPCFKSSLMGSFVPLGGFFSSPDVKCSFSSSSQYASRCNTCCKTFREVPSGLNKGCVASLADEHTICGTNNMLDNLKAKGGKDLISTPVAALQGKQGYLCQCPNPTQPSPKPEVCQESFQFPTVVGYQCHKEKAKNVNNDTSCTTSGSSNERDDGGIKSFTSLNLPKHSGSQLSKPTFLSSVGSSVFPAKVSENPPRTQHPLAIGSLSPYSLCISGVDDGQTSPSSVVSVSTDLGLELFSLASKHPKKLDEQSVNNSETLFKTLFGKIGRQCEALRIISQTVAQSWTSNGKHQKSCPRGDIWLNFTGPDIFGKKKIALALAETLYGSSKNFIHIDICSKNMVFPQKTTLGCHTVNGSEARSRGKTILDHIIEELRKMPSCVVLFENVHSADPLLQRSLVQAIKDGKFSDSYGREVATNNRIFVLTLKYKEHMSELCLKKKPLNFPEERIERAKGWPLQIYVKNVEDNTLPRTAENNYLCQTFMNKRKLNGKHETSEQCINTDPVKKAHRVPILSLDLNLPADISESDDGELGGDFAHERSRSWLEEYSDQLDKTLVKLVFDPFDYDALANNILNLIHASFNEVVVSKCLLDIEPRVIDQIIAAACLADRDKKVKDWIDRVLSKGFAEAQKRYQLTAQSTLVIATCEALYVEEQLQEACLPSNIILN